SSGPQGGGHFETDVGSPRVAVRDLVDRYALCHAPGSGRVAEADAPREDPTLIGGDTQNLERLGGMEELQQRGEAGADAFGARRQHGAPDRWVDGAAARVVLREGEEEERDLLEVVGQPLRRALHLAHGDRGGVVGVGRGRVELRLVDRLPELAHGVLVERGERPLLVRVVEEQEAPVLLVAARRGSDGRIEDAGLHVVGDRVGSDPAHGAGGVESLVEFHEGECRPGPGTVSGEGGWYGAAFSAEGETVSTNDPLGWSEFFDDR